MKESVIVLSFIICQLYCVRPKNVSMDNNAPPPVAMASFYDRPEIKRRQGGIDVSKHSKVFLFGKQSMKEVGMTKSTTSFF